MSDLNQYFAGREQFVELLEAVGVLSLEQFAAINPSTVLPELHQAKKMLLIETDIPSAHVFREWVKLALTAPVAPNPEDVIVPDLSSLPLATPVKPATPASNSLAMSTLPHKKNENVGIPNDQAPLPLKEIVYKPAVKAEPRSKDKKNTGKKGITHLTPVKTWFGALSVILLILGALTSIVFTFRSLMNEERGLMVMLLSFGPLLLSVTLYLILGLKPTCSICNGKIFSLKKYTRNIAAHHMFFGGYVLATALHVFFFRWFRCPYCGSAQQFTRKSRSVTVSSSTPAPNVRRVKKRRFN